jgi:hypothetical protein
MFQDISEIRIPSGGVRSLTRELTPGQREETMQFVLQTCQALVDSADELLAEVEKVELDAPEFVLGELPEPEPAKLIVPEFHESEWQSPAERDYILKLCKEAGKDFDHLTDQDKKVLQVSLDNYRSQFQSMVAQGHTSWDGSQN